MSDAAAKARLADRRLQAALKALDDAALDRGAASDDQPIFICAVGWRSGSTLMQRLLMTDPRLLVWGEPMDRLAVLDRATDMLSVVSERWPPLTHYYSRRASVDLTRDWVANLMPDASDFKRGLLGLFDGWLAAPARRRGFARWGVKEVRWSANQARLLRWLYPRAHIVVLVRHPALAYLSLKRWGLGNGGGGWWIRWPDRHVGDLETFAQFWNELAVGWESAAGDLGATVIRYEDLIGGRVDFGALGERLGLTLTPSTALDVWIGGSDPTEALTPEDRDRVNAITAEGRRLFNYGE